MKEGGGGGRVRGKRAGVILAQRGEGVEGLRSGRWGSDSGYNRGLEDQCCGSGIFIRDPDFLPILDPGSRIPDLKTSTKERGEKKFVVIPFCEAANFTKLKIILIFKC